MKYEEDNFHSKRKNNTGTVLIVIIVIVLLIAAVVAWFALSKSDSPQDMVSKTESKFDSFVSGIDSKVDSATSMIESKFDSTVSKIESEYNSMTSSYNNSDNASSKISTTDETAPTEEKVSSVPYSSLSFCKPVEGKIIKIFSEKELLYSKTFGDMRIHSGIDIACKKGTAVSSCADGKILTIEESAQYGTVITIDHSNGYTAKYAALDHISVKVGQNVKSGDIIGTVTTIPAECNDQDHLHFELYKNGIAVSPLKELGLED